MLWHHGAAVHRKRVNVRKRSKMLALANGSLIEMHTPRHWALTKIKEIEQSENSGIARKYTPYYLKKPACLERLLALTSGERSAFA